MIRDDQLKAMFLIGRLRSQHGLASSVRAILLPPAGANARHLVSRNKREGGYVGKRRDEEYGLHFHVTRRKRRHAREGHDAIRWAPLRDRSKL